LAFRITEGNRHDIVPAAELIEETQPRCLLGDRAYSSHAFRALLDEKKCQAVIPSSSSWTNPPAYDRDLYKARSEVECTFNLLKQARRFATRYEKTLRNYAAVVALGCMAFAETLSTIPFILIEEAQSGAMRERPSFLVITYLAVAGRLLTGFIAYSAVVAIASTRESQQRLREREIRAAKLEADLAQAQVQAIKMQVQPHFLFNTLHAINVLIRQDPATATRMVTQLGDLLRHTLSRATVTEVPLRSELEILTLYFEIERVRFRDRLSVVVDAAPDTLDALVPDLVLQPLAENAIKHGIAQSMEPGTVTVRAYRRGERLVLEIHDTGVGPPSDGGAERIGLTTVRTRLERLYGDEHALTVERGEHGGCVARIRLPFRTNA